MIQTLKAISGAIENLTGEGHLPEPGSVVVTPNSAMIFPELPGASVSGLIVWALHLDGPIDYRGEIVFRTGDQIITSVTATGKLADIDTTIAATTYRHSLRVLLDMPDRSKVSLTELQVRELAQDEEVLGKLP